MTTPTLSVRLRAWRSTQPCKHCASRGQIDGRECHYCRGTGTGISQATAAEIAGVPVRTWRNWEQRRREPVAAAQAHLERVMAGDTVVPPPQSARPQDGGESFD